MNGKEDKGQEARRQGKGKQGPGRCPTPAPLVLWGLKEKAFKGNDTLELNTATFSLTPCCASHLQRESSHISVTTGLVSSVNFFLMSFSLLSSGVPMVSIAESVEMYPGKREDVFFHFKRERRAEGRSSVGTGLAQHLQSPKFDPSVVMLPALGRQR